MVLRASDSILFGGSNLLERRVLTLHEIPNRRVPFEGGRVEGNRLQGSHILGSA